MKFKEGGAKILRGRRFKNSGELALRKSWKFQGVSAPPETLCPQGCQSWHYHRITRISLGVIGDTDPSLEDLVLYAPVEEDIEEGIKGGVDIEENVLCKALKILVVDENELRRFDSVDEYKPEIVYCS